MLNNYSFLLISILFFERYPIGRPVGTTIYPGMMITASGIYHFLQAIGLDVSVNDVCVFIPAGFALLTIMFVYLLTYEITSSHNMSIVATGLFFFFSFLIFFIGFLKNKLQNLQDDFVFLNHLYSHKKERSKE